ncbi:MAG: di-heme oxidoredictase family protein [Balneolales bacterium]
MSLLKINPVIQLLLIVGVTFAIMLGCELYPAFPDDNAILDAPIDGLAREQLNLHLKGDEEFGRRFSAEDGLGPVFVGQSCDACHPGEGKGHLVFNLVRFGKMEDGEFNPMVEQGGPQLQNRAIPGFLPEKIPEEATGIAEFTAPVIVGLGFLEALDDSTILNMADPDDLDGDGISGRPSLIDATDFLSEIASLSELVEGGGETRFLTHDGKFIGRFGKKGISINLLHQTVSAYHQDMGLTTDLIPNDLFNVQTAGISSEDDVPDPEVPSSVVSNVVFYLKTLRAPQRRNVDHPDVIQGEKLFTQAGCAGCHVPKLKTGKSSISQLSEVEFYPFTDLLLHDMGPELDDGYTEGSALASEWRTPPLWGLGLAERFQGGTPFYLHDGRAHSLRETIEYHGGESASSRSEFRDLTNEEQEQLIMFLKSL